MKEVLNLTNDRRYDIEIDDSIANDLGLTSARRAKLIVLLAILQNGNSPTPFSNAADLLDASEFRGSGGRNVCGSDLENARDYLIRHGIIQKIGPFNHLKLNPEHEDLFNLES